MVGGHQRLRTTYPTYTRTAQRVVRNRKQIGTLRTRNERNPKYKKYTQDTFYGAPVGTYNPVPRAFSNAVRRVVAQPVFNSNIAAAPFTTTGSSTLGFTVVRSLEYNATPSTVGALGAKWEQICRWSFHFVNKSSVDGAIVELYLCRNKKTGASESTLIGNYLPNIEGTSILQPVEIRTNIHIERQWTMTVAPGDLKAVTGVCSYNRSDKDWRDASNVANYIPTNSRFLVMRCFKAGDSSGAPACSGKILANFITYNNASV